MRIKHMVFTMIALTTLFGCGTNNTESMDNRQFDRYDERRDSKNGSVNESKGRTDFNKQNIQNHSNQGGEYRVAEQIADDVTSEVNEIDSAYVLTMGNNAYVACQLDNSRESKQNNDLSDKLEKQVTQAVKNSDNQIENVYVSSNPDFIDLTSNYMRDLDRGEPIEGFFDQFTEMIERVFPTRNR